MKVKYARKQAYTITVTHGSRTYHYGPFTYRRAAAYAATVIRENLKNDKQPSLAISHGGAMVVEVLGGNDVKPSKHYRARIADADIDAAVAGTATRDEHRYILIACRLAGANGTAP